MPVEPTESQKKAFKTGFLVVAIVLVAAAFLIMLGVFFGWLPEWKQWTR